MKSTNKRVYCLTLGITLHKRVLIIRLGSSSNIHKLRGRKMYHCCNISNREDNFDTHVLSLMHDLPIYKHLICSNSVAHCVCWIRGCRNLDLAPLLVGRHELSLRREVLELFVDSLFLDAALALNKR